MYRVEGNHVGKVAKLMIEKSVYLITPVKFAFMAPPAYSGT